MGTNGAIQAVRHKFSASSGTTPLPSSTSTTRIQEQQQRTARRLVEANTLRADADALGSNKNIIYVGDYNVFTSSESGYQKLLAGNGQANDPINKPGNWNGDSTFKNIHTQSAVRSGTIGQTGFDSGGGMDSRFDIQLISNNMKDSHGLAYITNSYQ